MRVYPVIHINDDPTVAVEQADKAFDAGADGVYLINHIDLRSQPLFDTFNDVNTGHPDEFVGLNMLGFQPSEALFQIEDALEVGGLSRAPDGLWVDDIRSDYHLGDALMVKEHFEKLKKIRLLGGVAFKYTQTYTENPTSARKEVEELLPFVDTVTTSGRGTGSAPTVRKIRAMKEATGSTLAVASGITLANLNRYQGIVDEVLVSSSIETKPYSGVFDDKKLAAFIKKAHTL